MKKITFTILCISFLLSTAFAQKGIDFRQTYPGGGKLLMYLDSGAKNVYYWNVYPNQPNTYFSYLPDVNNLSLQINFRKNIKVPNFRYTILLDNKPFVVNKSIDETQLNEVDRGEDDLFRATGLGSFPIKNKVVTVLVYDIENPADIDKSVFYGKPIPKAKIKNIARRFKSGEGVEYDWITDPKEKTNLILTENDDELTIYKDRSDIDYIYEIVINDKKTQKTIFASTVWNYGGIFDETRKPSPYVATDKSIFKKSGDYEVVIRPKIKWDGYRNSDISQKEIENYATRYTLSVTLENESYSKKDLIIYGLIICVIFGAIGGASFTYIKKKNAKKLLEQYKEKEIVTLQLNSVRSQLNPHFLFNALAGIQNLMNKNEIDNANKYLSKFARITRNVLNNTDLISLAQEKT
ncbi:MAG: histidine kinase, partial [Pedobacter sp.]